MRIKFFTILLLICIAFTQTGKSQELSLSNIQNVKISQLTDQQIIQAWTKLEETGIPEKEAYKLMAQKGLPPGEVEEFKKE
jgi:uncharacterized membrane protein